MARLLSRVLVPGLVTVAVAAALLAPGPAFAQATSVDQLTYPPLPDFSLPKPSRTVLDNGMVVLVMENHDLPLVSVTARIRTGSLLEPPDKTGLASLTGNVLRAGGTQALAPDELDRFLEDRAASIETGIGDDSGTASMNVLREDFDEVLQVFADVLRRPRFDEGRLQVARRGIEAGIARQNDDPGAIAAREFRKLIYGADSPFARTVTYDTLASITRDDLVAWHARDFHPNRIIIGVHGDIVEADALAAIRRVFGDWPAGPDAPVTFPEPAPQSPAGIFQAVKADVAQSSIRIGHQGALLSTHPDYYPVQILNEVLAGSFTSRLFSTVRTEKGLAYSVGGSVGSQFTRIAPFVMATSTKTSTTIEAIRALVDEARRIVDEPPTAAEIARAKQSILNSFIFNAATTQQVLAQQLTYEYYDAPRDWLERYRAGIEAVTEAQVAEVAKKYIHPDRFAILVVGPEDGRDAPLSSLGEVTTLDITIPEPSGPAAPAPAAETGPAAAAPPSAEALAGGRALIDRAVEAMGGASAVDAVTGYREVAAVTVVGPQGEMALDATATVALPDRIRQEVTTPMGRMQMVVGPEGAAVVMPDGASRPMPDAQREQIQQQLRRSPIVLLQKRSGSTFEAAVIGEAEVGGTPVQLVRVTSAEDAVTLGIDPATGRILRMVGRGRAPTGAPADVVTDLGDFRPVGPLTLPHSRVSTVNGEVVQRATVTSVEVNPAVDEATFRP